MTFPTRPLNILGTGLALTTGLLCLLFPRMDGDAAVYALLAKHMVLQGDAFNLVFQGKDWLDKPHFPFWMMAIFFKLFGINEYAYHVPGLLFYGLGAWFTRKIALHFYDEVTASFAVLIYLSLFGLLLAAGAARAALTIEITGAGASSRPNTRMRSRDIVETMENGMLAFFCDMGMFNLWGGIPG